MICSAGWHMLAMHTRPPTPPPTPTSRAGTASRIGGVSFDRLAEDMLAMHALAYRAESVPEGSADAHALPDPGDYHFRFVRVRLCGA